ncbi:hypothetical protein RIEGSTA812A_PEG_1090 [invertebrate metagenome]|uniref:Uncharacterized protein n=1 Tax=invertebrate metagenome TaxID=1711999 RepID=A0A484H676_9ZZZZ
MSALERSYPPGLSLYFLIFSIYFFLLLPNEASTVDRKEVVSLIAE